MLCSAVRGQELARDYFRRAIRGRRLSHAYLFVGPRGTGKGTFAAELARALLCRAANEARDFAACGECVSCRTFASGNHPSFLRLAPAPGKQIEIDAVRAIIEELALRSGERRVVILDDAERIGIEAANALLKILEEPPLGTVFILASSRAARLPATIHSRCHRVPFVPLQRDDFAAALAAQGYDREVADAHFLACGGAPGAALRLLEGTAACGGGERLRDLLCGVGAERPEALIDYLPALPEESRRDRVRRLLELVLGGLRGARERLPDPSEEADSREAHSARALAFASLIDDLDDNLNADLALEAAAEILRAGSPSGDRLTSAV
ncbi:MAG: DNA polymerase III subunit delta' [Planctomycetes bacterium]|nr:DNA polymerase III subunit delta' [Planctomycetota bacterium]